MYLWISFDVFQYDYQNVTYQRYCTSGMVGIDVTGHNSSVCFDYLSTAAWFLSMSDRQFDVHPEGKSTNSHEGKVWQAVKRCRVHGDDTSMRMTSWQIVKAFD